MPEEIVAIVVNMEEEIVPLVVEISDPNQGVVPLVVEVIEKGDTGATGATGAAGVGVPVGGTTGQVLSKIDATNYNTQWTSPSTQAESLVHAVKNGNVVAMTKGQAVYITGASGTNVIIGLAQANGEPTSSKTIGLVTTDLAKNGQGYVITDGLLSGLNTDAATADGDAVYLSPTVAGGFVYGVNNKPSSPNHLVYIGVVSRKHATQGEILVKVQNGFELQELHNVTIDGAGNELAENDILICYDSISNHGYWKNTPLSGVAVDLVNNQSVFGQKTFNNESYFESNVNINADLVMLDGAYLQNQSLTWVINPDGLGGAQFTSLTVGNSGTDGTIRLNSGDGGSVLQPYSSDNTKFNTMPALDGDLATLGGPQTFAGAQSFSGQVQMTGQLPSTQSSAVNLDVLDDRIGWYPMTSANSINTKSLLNGRSAVFYKAAFNISTGQKGVMNAFPYQAGGNTAGRFNMSFVPTSGSANFMSLICAHYAYGNVYTGNSWNVDIRRAPDSGSVWFSTTITGTPTVVNNQVITGSLGSTITCNGGTVSTSVTVKSVSGRLPCQTEIFTTTGGTFTIAAGGAVGTITSAQAAYTGLLLPSVGLFLPSTIPTGAFYINGHYIA